MMGKEKTQDKRFLPCTTFEENIEIYRAGVGKVLSTLSIAPVEKKERIEMEGLLANYRADLSSGISVPTKPHITVLLSKSEEGRLKELVKKYDDPQKLQKGLGAKVKGLTGEVLALAINPAGQIARRELRNMDGDAFRYAFDPSAETFYKKLQAALKQVNQELGVDGTGPGEAIQGLRPEKEKPGLETYLSETAKSQQVQITDAKSLNEAGIKSETDQSIKKVVGPNAASKTTPVRVKCR